MNTHVQHKTWACKTIESYFKWIGRSYEQEIFTLFVILAIIALVGLIFEV